MHMHAHKRVLHYTPILHNCALDASTKRTASELASKIRSLMACMAASQPATTHSVATGDNKVQQYEYDVNHPSLTIV